jgi:predicted ArsR family transcriptional regulator
VAQHIDGAASLEEIATKLGVTIRQVREALEELRKLGVVEEVKIIK